MGLKIQFGSMTKSFHPGRAAQNGLTAALLAAQNYDAAEAVLEGKDGWGQAVSQKRTWTEVTGDLGTRWEAALNTYKPFACGIVTHPAIDAAIQLRNENRLTADQIEASVRAIIRGIDELGDFDGELEIDDTRVGDGYGIPTEASREAQTLLARLQALVDTFSAK